MAELSAKDKILLAAIELLTKQIADLPLAIAMNAGKTAEEVLNRQHEKAAAAFDPGAFNRDAAQPGAAGPVRGSPDIGAPRGPLAGLGDVSRAAGAAVGAAGKALAATFTKLLGPLGSLSTIVTSSTSGFNVFNAALDLLSNSLGSVFMPVFYSLSVAAVSLGDTVSRKLMPAMDKFSKVVLDAALPAITVFTNAVSLAADALGAIGRFAGLGGSGGGPGGSSDTSGIGGAILGAVIGYKKGGVVGALAGSTLGGVVGRNIGEAGTGAAFGALQGARFGHVGALVGATIGAATAAPDSKRNEKPSEYYSRQRKEGKTILGSVANTAGESVSEFFRWATGQGDGKGHGGVKGEGAGGAGGGAGGGAETVDRAKQLAMQQLAFQIGGKGSIGDVTGNWSRAQQSVLGLSPFEQETLRLQRETLAALQRGLMPDDSPTGAPPVDPYRPPEGS